nr:CHASE3 domain-containing protein [Pedobacter sp. ASV2]
MKNSFFSRPSMGFILSAILTVATSALSYYSVQKFFISETWVDHTNLVKIKLEQIISAMKDAETGQRGFLLTGNQTFLEPYNESEKRVRAAFDTVRDLTKDNMAQQNEFKSLKEKIDAKYDLLNSTINQKKVGGSISQDILLMGKSHMDQTRNIITRMENREDVLLSIRLSTLKIYGTLSLISIVLAFLISCGSTIYFYRRTVKDFERRLLLEEEKRRETISLEKKIAIINDFAERIGKGEYGMTISQDDLK